MHRLWHRGWPVLCGVIGVAWIACDDTEGHRAETATATAPESIEAGPDGSATDPSDGGVEFTTDSATGLGDALCSDPAVRAPFALSCPSQTSPPYVTPEPHVPGSLLRIRGDLGAATANPPPVATIVTADNGARTYVGRRYVPDPRALTIVTLGSAAELVEQREIPIGGSLAAGERRSLLQLILDAPRHRLYALINTDIPGGEFRDAQLLSYVLDDTGMPTGAATIQPVDIAYAAPTAMALHPDGRHLYIVGDSDPDVLHLDLDENGDPLPTVTRFAVGNGLGKIAVAVHPAGARLFLGSNVLEVFPLVDGVPSEAETTLAWPAPTRIVHAETTLDYFYDTLNFVVTDRAIFRQQGPRPTTGGVGWPIQSWQLDYALLDADGALTDGVVHTRPDVTHSWLAADADTLIVASPEVRGSSFIGTTLHRITLADGVPDAEVAALEPSLVKQTVWQFAKAADDVVVVTADDMGWWAEGDAAIDPVGNVNLTLQVDATPPEGGPWFGPDTVGATIPVYLDSLTVSLSLDSAQDTASFSADSHLKNYAYSRALQVEIGANVCVADAQVTATMTYEDRNDGATYSETVSASSKGCFVTFFLDGNAIPYAAGRPRLRDYATQMETYSGYLDPAIGPAQPIEFPISCSSDVGGGNGLAALEKSLALLEGVGCNSLQTDTSLYSFNVPAADMKAALDAHGFVRRETGAYMPNDAYFSFDPRLAPDALAAWVDRDILPVLDMLGGPRDRIFSVTLADEPGWYYPDTYALASGTGIGAEAFITFLQAQGFTPADLGASTWDEVEPAGRSVANDLPHRRLFYWTQRFFANAATAGMKAAREALETAIGHAILTPVNFNNWEAWMLPSPNAAIGYSPTVNADTGLGMMDWYEAGRTSAHTLFSEDWFPDYQTDEWVYRSQGLRSAASLGDQRFGSYVIAGTASEIHDGLSMRVLSLVGRGAAFISYFAFGPEPLFPGNCWSDAQPVYPELQRTNQRVRFADHIFATGVAATPEIAIMSAQDAALWAPWRPDQTSPETVPSHEDARGVSLMLAHAGHDALVLDDRAIADGILTARGIKALYVSTPNVSVAAVDAIARFVASGGTLVLGPGAGERDELDSPSAGFADVVAGCGTIERPATLMGRDYLHSGYASNRTRLPDGFDAGLRDQMVGWLGANARLSVRVEQPLVEVLRVDTDDATALVLLNWDPNPERCITVQVPGGAGFTSVASSESAPVTTERSGADLEIQLTLGRVAVLKLTR